jgi:hypothetical protein
MSITRNRELSQFGSFIHLDDATQNIGITSLSTPFVGIGTTNPSFKLDVAGDINFNGIFLQNGSPFVASRWDVGVGSSIYRSEGNVGIGTSTLPEKLTVVGNVSAGQFISTVTSGTAPLVVLSDTEVTNLNASFLRSKTPPNGDIVGTTDTQTLTNKTLTSPIINTATIGSVGITFNGTTGTTILQASATASGTLTLPAATDTLTGRATTDTLTNKTIAAGSNTITGLTNTNLSGTANISNTNLANSTISGVALGSNLNALTFTNYLTSSGTYTGATARTVSVAGTSINTANTLVARNASGDFTAGSITATQFTATSDISLKENVITIENALEKVLSLRGVEYDRIDSGEHQIGVIAQEVEKVIPEVVYPKSPSPDYQTKSVAYGNLIGLLIEAIKEQQKEIEELKKKFNEQI